MSEADTCPERIGLCLVLAMMAGVLQCLMGVCRLGAAYATEQSFLHRDRV